MNVGDRVMIVGNENWNPKELLGAPCVLERIVNWDTDPVVDISFIYQTDKEMAMKRHKVWMNINGHLRISASCLTLWKPKTDSLTVETVKPKDYCYKCNNSNLYWVAMAAKCSTCHRVILGG